jgi:hypothetical protein
MAPESSSLQTPSHKATMLRITLGALLSSILLFASPSARASESAVVFYLDNHRHVVRLDRLPGVSESIKALLALYALENGAGCEGKDENNRVKCALTRELGLGVNCSEAHIRLVRSWFEITPNLTSRWHERWNAKAKEPGSLENLCYGQPDSASWYNVWNVIKLKSSGEIVEVEAILAWGSQYGHGRVRYRTSYRIGSHSISEISSQVTELSRSSESAFGTGRP